MKKTIKKSSYSIRILIAGLIVMIACEDFINIDSPKTEITTKTVFTTDASAAAAIRGIYSLMMTNQSFTKGEIERYSGLSADEFINFSSNNAQQQFSLPALQTNNAIVYSNFWKEAYLYILNANAMIEGLQRATSLSVPVKNQLEGEARFIRAFAHFYLVNLFGDIPYVTSTDYRKNANAIRDTELIVYEKIIQDLVEAQELLVEDFSFAPERVHPNKGAATALLARVYLYTQNWEAADMQASSLIANTDYVLGADLSKTFQKGSKETIWQLMPVVPGINTPQGQMFILNTIPANAPGRVAMEESLYNSFENEDVRKEQWVGIFINGNDTYYFPYKYKVDYSDIRTEYNIVLRLAEQYLIRAEARAHQDNIDGALEDINIIRNRAGLSNTTANDKSTILLAIEQERKVELFVEWGHRWMDLKRTNRADAILAPLKTDWQPTDQLYPIPESEILVNPQLSQNPGY